MHFFCFLNKQWQSFWFYALQCGEGIWSERDNAVDEWSLGGSLCNRRSLRCGGVLGEELHGGTQAMELEKSIGRLEFAPLGVFYVGFLAVSPSFVAQFRYHEFLGELLRPCTNNRWRRIHRTLDFPFYSEQISRANRHLFYRHSQEAAHVPTLVSPCHGPRVLLALLHYQFHSRNHFCYHESGSTCSHVLLLLSHGNQMQTQVVQPHGYHCLAR